LITFCSLSQNLEKELNLYSGQIENFFVSLQREIHISIFKSLNIGLILTNPYLKYNLFSLSLK
jgi:hypothetical protein